MRYFILLIVCTCSLSAFAETDGKTAASPWQGTWSGSENSSLGGKVQVRVKIKVTKETISGTWNVHAQMLKPITGQVEGKKAHITILQGGSTIEARLVDENTVKYSGIRGYGTLARQEAD